MITEKENFLRICRGEQGEWVPNYFDACTWCVPEIYKNKLIEGSGNPNKKIIDIFGFEHDDHEKYINWLGVEYTVTVDGAMPSGKHPITDITKWREQIPYPFPNLEEIDFKAQAEAFYSVVDHNEKAVAYFLGEAMFFVLVNTMGVAEALCALVEEPEAVHDFLKEITDYEEKRFRLSAPYYKPDIFVLADDVATVKDLFMSPKIYTEMFAPYHRQLTNAALEFGLIVEMHCCGKCEKLIPEWVDMGITVWQPAQAVNDLKAIKEKYGNKFVLNGCWDTNGPAAMVGASEDVVRQSVRDTIDEFAPGGGFIFWDTGRTGGDFEKFDWLADEANKYGKEFYKKM